MRLYHRTTHDAAQGILRDGFRNGAGRYMTDQEWQGVWLSDVPIDPHGGPSGDMLLAVDLNLSEKAIAEYEWKEAGKGYREWLIPAELINANVKNVTRTTD